MCLLCDLKSPSALTTASDPASGHPARWSSRRAFLLAGAAATGSAAAPALAQVDVGQASSMRKLVPAAELEGAATQQYGQLMKEARQQNALLPASHPQVRRLRTMAQRLIPQSRPWNARASAWQWEVNLIQSDQINAFCMPGGKIAFYTGILDRLKLTDDEAAMVMGQEMAHALREHARERLAKSQATGLGLLWMTLLLDSAFNGLLGAGLLCLAWAQRPDEGWPKALRVLGLVAGAASLPVALQFSSDTFARLLLVAGPLWLAWATWTSVVLVRGRGG